MRLLGTFLRITSCLVGIAVASNSAEAQSLRTQSVPKSAVQTIPNQTVRPSTYTVDSPQLTTATRTLVPLAPKGMPKSVENVQADELGFKIGYTFYDFQTNASMPNRLIYQQDGPDEMVQMLWMASLDSTRDAATRIPGFNTGRGTYYTALYVGEPANIIPGIDNWMKCETRRAGWPSIVEHADGAVGFTSHTPVSYYENTGFGTKPELLVDITVPADSANWPRLAAGDQEVLHMIYNKTYAGTTANTTISQVVYRRSTNKGLDWSPEIIFSGASSVFGNLTNGIGGDSYALTAKGNTVVAAWTDNSLRVIGAISTDNGQNWTPNQAVLVFGPTYTDIDSTTDKDGNVTVYTDTVATPNGHIDVIIDEAGVSHFVFGVTPAHVIRTGTGASRQGTITQASDSKEYFYKNSSLAYRASNDSLIYFMGQPDLSSWDGSGHIINNRFLDGVSRWPQLGLNEVGDLYCVFGSIKPGDVAEVSTDTTGTWVTTEPDTLVTLDAFYGHIYATYKPAGLKRWSEPMSITPDGVNCQYASLADKVRNGRMHIGYSASSTPGDRVTNVEMDVDTANVYYWNFDSSLLPLVNSVTESRELAAAIVISPNPVHDNATISINAEAAGKFTVSLYTPLGQLVARSTSPSELNDWNVQIPTSQISSGSYICTIEQNGAVTSRTISILH